MDMTHTVITSELYRGITILLYITSNTYHIPFFFLVVEALG